MKYGLMRQISIYRPDTKDGAEVLSMPRDYVKMQQWADANASAIASNDEILSVLGAYAWAYYALDRVGMKERFALPDEPTIEALEELAGVISVQIDEVENELPLSKSGSKSRK